MTRLRSALLLLAGAAGAALLVVACNPGCTPVRQRTAVATTAFIDCQAPNVAGVLAELVPLAKQAALVAISGDGSVDTAKLRAAASPLRSDLGRCALAAAIAALAESVAPPSVASVSALAALPDGTATPPAVDGATLRAAFVTVRNELGWAPVVVAGSVL
jgi:hypothetical protein